MNESGSNNNPIGLYRHKEAGTFIGALDETQANAFVNKGHELFKEGFDAAMASEADIKTLLSETKQIAEEPATKKGK